MQMRIETQVLAEKMEAEAAKEEASWEEKHLLTWTSRDVKTWLAHIAQKNTGFVQTEPKLQKFDQVTGINFYHFEEKDFLNLDANFGKIYYHEAQLLVATQNMQASPTVRQTMFRNNITNQ
jgi:hypothetical protein